jgi:hypothetical protein
MEFPAACGVERAYVEYGSICGLLRALSLWALSLWVLTPGSEWSLLL